MPTTVPLFTDQSLNHILDSDLLRRFRMEGDHAAFELLVWRHRRLVFGICRRVAGHTHDAEDAAQATFLVLARRADTIRGTNIGGWLAGVAYRCASRARTKRHGQLLADLTVVASPATSSHDGELSAILDTELNRLPEKYRVPMVLCYLEGKSYEQVAVELDCPLGTLCGWLTRAKAMLRRRLVRRGLTLSLGGLTAYLELLGSPAFGVESTIRSITAAILSDAAGEGIPGRAATIANGVLNMMTVKSRLLPMLLGTLVFFGVIATAISTDKPEPPTPVKAPVLKKTDAERLQGTWVFDTANHGSGNNLVGMVWKTKLTVTGEAVLLKGFLGLDIPLKGTLQLDPSTEPKRFDLKLEEFDLASGGLPMKIAAGSYAGIYEFTGDRIRLSLSTEAGGKRPSKFDESSEKQLVGTLVKAPATFQEFPKEFEVKVIGLDGKPASGAIVATFMARIIPAMTFGPDGKQVEPSKLTEAERKAEEEWNRVPENAIFDERNGCRYFDAKRTGKDGTAKILYEEYSRGSLVAHDLRTDGSGNARISPALLLSGSLTVTLQPSCRVFVKARSASIANSKENSLSYLVNIMVKDGRTISSDQSTSGDLEYSLPPGEYTVEVFGNDNFGRKTAKFTVPEHQSEFTLPTIVLPTIGLAARNGQPAPELFGVVAWKGKAVQLADLKGKIVLLHFWMYGCGGCIQDMPTLIDLHDKYHDKGLAIVGVHIDPEDQIDSAKVLDDKLALYIKNHWNGKDIPFPVALVSGKRVSKDENALRGALADTYGVSGYPHTIIIGRDGKIAGHFNTNDSKKATERIEFLLKDEKK